MTTRNSPTGLQLKAVALGAGALLLLGACGGTPAGSDPTERAQPEDSTTEAAPTTIEIEDNDGVKVIEVPFDSVIATDNRTFRTLDDWGVELSAAAVTLMTPGLSYIDNPDVVDLGTHREPNLEAIVAVQPDVIINGQRFAQYKEDFEKLAPGATLIDLDPRDGENYADELIRQTRVLGQVFGHEAEAEALIADFNAAIERAKAAYDPTDTVMGVITSGGTINYSAPGSGRTVGPVFDVVGLTPALEVDQASTDHEGDDISVEAIAQSNPAWIIVMDRDAAVSASSDEDYTPANELIATSAALQNVTAVTAGQIVYMPQYTYLDEGIQTYTDFLNTFADALEK